jgi:hypothetical protein
LYQGLSFEIGQVIGEAYATGLFVSLFSAQQPSGNLGPSGAPDGTWIPIAGLSNIPCTAPPPSEARIAATEVKALEEILTLQIKHVLLNNYFPQLNGASDMDWRCLIDGVAYDILGVEHDSQKQMTRLEVRIAAI